MKPLSIIVAVGKDGVIGHQNQMPWHLPDDLQYFKQLTTGNIILMGRKTYESIGRPLPYRINIVLSSNNELNDRDEVIIVPSVEALLKLVDEKEEWRTKKIFVIGGASVFKQLIPYADEIYLTQIDHYFEGDTYFPELNVEDWQEVSSQEGITDKDNPYNYHFKIYTRIRRNSTDVK
jgi:dihydrofolate reductase